MNIPIDKIRPNPEQPRKYFDEKGLRELAASIEKEGIVVPLLVRPTEKGYEIVHGERRWRAAKMVGLREVPCEVRGLDDVKSFYTSLAENIQRQDLNAVEEARAIKRAMALEGLSMRKVAKRIGKSPMYVSLKMEIIEKWPYDLQELLAAGDINEAIGRAFYKLFEVWWDFDVGPRPPVKHWSCTWTCLRMAGFGTARKIEEYAERLRHDLVWALIVGRNGYGYYGSLWKFYCPTSIFLKNEGRWADEILEAIVWSREHGLWPDDEENESE